MSSRGELVRRETLDTLGGRKFERALMTPLEKLAQLGLSLPDPPAGVGNYEAWVRTGNLVMTSGQLAWVNGVLQYPGRLGAEVSDEEGYQAALPVLISSMVSSPTAAH